MADTKINHEGFQRRLDVITSILNAYRLEAKAVTPVEYDEDCPFPYNNFIYKIELSSPLHADTFGADETRRPGTLAPSTSDVSTMIMRLSNPRANGLNNAHRVENEVAAQALFRDHLSTHHPNLASIIPEIYAWEPCRQPEVSGEAGFGCTMCEFMPGANLDEQFPAMELSQKLGVIEQVADFCPEGWKESGLRVRIDELLVDARVAKLIGGVDTTQRTLIHGDFTLNNFLYDKTTSRITALLDFDFSWVAHPSHEFFTGLWDIGGGLRSNNDNMVTAVVTGKFDNVIESLFDEENTKWQVAQAWDAALAARGAIRPSSIAGIDRLRQLMELEDALCPSRLGNERAIERLRRQGKLEPAFKTATEKLAALLNDLDA